MQKINDFMEFKDPRDAWNLQIIPIKQIVNRFQIQSIILNNNNIIVD